MVQFYCKKREASDVERWWYGDVVIMHMFLLLHAASAKADLNFQITDN
jgi:hypothetical protein